MRVGAGAQADLAALADAQGLLVLVEDGHLPARHRPPHRSLAHLDGREVAAQRVALGEAVVVEHGHPVLVAEPADHLGVERLAGRTGDAQLRERVGLARVGHSGHRPQRRRRGEHVLHPVLGQEAQVLLGVVAALARLHERHRPVAPRAEQRADAGRPGPLTGAVEELAVAHVVAELELLVGEQIAVGVQDALGQSGRAGGVVQLGGVVGSRVGHLVAVRRTAHRVVEVDVGVLLLAAHHEHPLDQPLRDAVAVGGIGDDRLGARVAQAVLDALVAVEDGHREQDRAALVGAEEDRRRLGQRGEQRRDAVAALHPDRLQHVGEAIGQVLELAEADPALVALPVLPDHREAVAVVLVADVARDVVALRHLPAVGRAHVLVAAELVLAKAHSLSSLPPEATP